MERGIIAFPIITDADVLDAATILRILEEHHDEKIAALDEIAIRRTLIRGQDIERL